MEKKSSQNNYFPGVNREVANLILKTMTISLETTLRTGNLGDLRKGMTKAEVEDLLGPPDATGGTSRKYPQPTIYLYGTVEFWFMQTDKPRPYEMTSFFWEAGEKGNFKVSRVCTVEAWDFTPETTFEEIEAYLNNRAIAREYHDQPAVNNDKTPVLILESGITIMFNQNRLYSLSG